MTVPSHSTPLPSGAAHGLRNPGKAPGKSAQAGAGAPAHEKLLHAVGQLDRLLHELESGDVDEAGRASARDLVAWLDELLDTRFADQEQRLFALFRRDADARVRQATDTLRLDHDWITGNWRELRPMLDSLARSYCWVDIDALRGAAELFTALVRDHVGHEAALLARASPVQS